MAAAAIRRLSRQAALAAGAFLALAQAVPVPRAAGAAGVGGAPAAPALVISTVAGTTVIAPVVPAAEAVLPAASGLAVDRRDGVLYIAEAARHAIFRLAPGGPGLEHFAGTGVAGFGGDGGPARAATFHLPTQLAVDAATGNLLVADSQNHRVRAIARDGSRVWTAVGCGIRGVPDDRLPTLVPKGPDLLVAHFSGDGGPATEAELNLPSGIAVDGDGNLYVADSGNHRVRVVNRQAAPIVVAGVEIAPGAIRTVAGDGDGSDLAFPKSIGVDAAGSIWVVDAFRQRLCRIARTGGVETMAIGGRRHPPGALPGQGWSAPSLDGLAIGAGGEVFYSDLNGHAVYRYRPGTTAAAAVAAATPDAAGAAGGPAGGSELIAGVGLPGASADGAVAAGSPLAGPGALAAGAGGELYLVETARARVRKLTDAGRLATVAGGGAQGEEGAARDALFAVPGPIGADAAGDLFLADSALHSLRVIRAADGQVQTLRALAGRLGRGTAIACDATGGLYVADAARNMVLRVGAAAAGGADTVAGNGLFGYSGDGGQATAARLSGPAGLAVHPRTGELYISTIELPAVRKVGRGGVISTVAGTGKDGFAGDGGPARAARFKWPLALAFDRRGNLYVADFFNQRVRRVAPDGTISTFAGTGARGLSGDGGPARDATLNGPVGLAVDAADNLLIVDSNNHCIRLVESLPPHRIRTIAGTGQRGFAGDGGPAATARLNLPRGLALGGDGTLYISDSLNGRVRAARPGQADPGATRPRQRQAS